MGHIAILVAARNHPMFKDAGPLTAFTGSDGLPGVVDRGYYAEVSAQRGTLVLKGPTRPTGAEADEALVELLRAGVIT